MIVVDNTERIPQRPVSRVSLHSARTENLLELWKYRIHLVQQSNYQNI